MSHRNLMRRTLRETRKMHAIPARKDGKYINELTVAELETELLALNINPATCRKLVSEPSVKAVPVPAAAPIELIPVPDQPGKVRIRGPIDRIIEVERVQEVVTLLIGSGTSETRLPHE